MTVNDVEIRYEQISNIRHRGGDSPAFVFEYAGRNFALPYSPEDFKQILPYLKKASKMSSASDSAESVMEGAVPSRAEPAASDAAIPEPGDAAPAEAESDAADDAAIPEPGDSAPAEPASARKKPSKWIIIIGLVVVAAIIIACAIGFHSGKGSEPAVSGIEEEIVLEPVDDDKSGSWKYCVLSNPADPAEYALDYYKKCFEDGDTVHWIVNYGNNTTTSILNEDGRITVTVYARVDGEEDSADTLGDGMVYDIFTVDPKTGEIESLY